MNLILFKLLIILKNLNKFIEQHYGLVQSNINSHTKKRNMDPYSDDAADLAARLDVVEPEPPVVARAHDAAPPRALPLTGFKPVSGQLLSDFLASNQGQAWNRIGAFGE